LSPQLCTPPNLAGSELGAKIGGDGGRSRPWCGVAMQFARQNQHRGLDFDFRVANTIPGRARERYHSRCCAPFFQLMEDIMRFALAALALIVVACPAVAQWTSPPGLITMIRTGWETESFAIVTQQPINNPAKCRTADGYLTDSSKPGYNTFYAAALAAYVSKIPVTVTIAAPPVLEPKSTEPVPSPGPIVTNCPEGAACSWCDQGRPRLIGINLLR
jgi:hypothetical protein